MEDKTKNHVGISEDIDNDLVGLPTLLWHYGSLEAEAYQLALTAKADMEQAHARTYKVLKEMSRKDKATEALLSAEVELDPEYRRYVAKHIEAEGNARKMRALVESLRAKKDALIQLGSNHRMQVRAGVDHVRG
jgi:hypothetical protein